LLETLCAALLALMVLLVFGNVVLRYGFNSGITLSEEIARWLFIWITFLGAIVALRERAHLGSDLLIARFPEWGKRLCECVSYALMLFITWLLFKGSLDQVRINWDVAAPSSGMSMAMFYGAGVMFALSTALILVCDMLRALSTARESPE
jgi:TRAP-type transport system small permease protein